ncbi:MAG: STAS domain-containing protein [Mariprofundales bacterium]|nr:STAS domain-containing protein [Mariprofundales bacterium]
MARDATVRPWSSQETLANTKPIQEKPLKEIDIKIHTPDEKQVHISIIGEINIHTAPQLHDSLHTAFRANPDEITIDLSAVPFMDTAGIATLVEGLQWSRNAPHTDSHSGHRTFRLQGVTAAVRDLFGLAKLSGEFTIV